jgi:hypothetical protein
VGDLHYRPQALVVSDLPLEEDTYEEEAVEIGEAAAEDVWPRGTQIVGWRKAQKKGQHRCTQQVECLASHVPSYVCEKDRH